MFYMLCFTKGTPAETKEVFCRPHPGYEPYDTCIEVTEPEDAFNAIIDDGLFMDSNGQYSIPSSDIFCEFAAAQVTYRHTLREWHRPSPSISPFEKDVEFSAQKEFRFVFNPMRESGDRLFVHVPGISKLFREVPI